ncbi:MAG: PTS sugar transporter subunit IIB [Oscillospiraceae bacterium]|nr:PTS sugar transporter subunit IIB [Oscillospiraceae bacterium]
MAVEFARIDDRLLHGQVCTTWIRALNLEQCIVVNEKIAGDDFQRSLLDLAAPQGMRVVYFSPQKFVEVAASKPINRRTMLLFNDPADVLYLVEHGYALQRLNVGGMKNNGEKRQIARAVAVSDAQAQTLRRIADAGVEVTIQMVPNDTKITLAQALA